MTRPHPTSIEERAVALLGNGLAAESVASALGVSASYISQLLADDQFANKVTELRYDALQQHTVRDNRYDEMEDKLLDKLDKAIPMMYKPGEILGAIKTINGARRRGQPNSTPVTNNQVIVNLTLPAAITQTFAVNSNNQVIKAGDQELLTLPSGKLLEMAEAKNEQVAAASEVTTDDL